MEGAFGNEGALPLFLVRSFLRQDGIEEFDRIVAYNRRVMLAGTLDSQCHYKRTRNVLIKKPQRKDVLVLPF